MGSPKTFVSSPHQVAGHGGALSSSDNELFAKPTSQQEIDFYEYTQRKLQKDVCEYAGGALSDWMPLYMGALTEGADLLVEKSLVLESIAEDRPAVEDARRGMKKTGEGAAKNDEKGPGPRTEENAAKSHENRATSGPNATASGSLQEPPCGAEKAHEASSLPEKDLDSSVPNSSKASQKFAVLQNLTHGFTCLSIIDIKLGSLLTDELASPEKALRLAKVSESTTSGSLGWRICGMKLFNGASSHKPPDIFPGMSQTISSVSGGTGTYLQFNKIFGRLLNKETATDGLRLFFEHIQDRDVSQWLLSRFHQRLQLLYNCLLDEEIRVVSGSLLLIYETNSNVWKRVKEEGSYDECDPLVQEAHFDDSDDESGDLERTAPLSSLHFIDFSHAKYVPGKGPDENILEGLENLIELVGGMLG